MGEKKRKAAAGIDFAARLTAVTEAATAVGYALQRLFLAASGQLGGDCYAHGVLAQALLKEQGFDAQLRAGYAAWRCGTQDGAVVSHIPSGDVFIPGGGPGKVYHVWLTIDSILVDVTTYSLPIKMAELDAFDGGQTQVEWAPPVLIAPLRTIERYGTVAQAPDAGHFYYEEVPGMLRELSSGYQLDETELSCARLLLKDANIAVLGVNSFPNT